MTTLTRSTVPGGTPERSDFDVVHVEAPLGPLAFIQTAVERGASADELDKLLTLHERVTKAHADRAYTEAMRRCQERMPVVLKTALNQHTRAKYPLFENLLQLVKPIYVSEGFALSFGTEESILPGHYRIICDVKHNAGHSERYHADFPVDGQGAQGGKSSMNAIQGVGSTMTYARRYLTALVFNLTIAGEDTDAARSPNPHDQAKVEEDLAELRGLYADADLSPADEAAFWKWANCGSGNFSDLPIVKHGDAKAMLQRKITAKRKAVAS
jgi:ERF superfamily protein